MNYTAKQFHLHYIAQYRLIVKSTYQYDTLYVLDEQDQLLVYMKFESNHPNEEALKLLSLPFQQVYVSVPTNHVTFIPETLFQASDLDKYAAFMENPGRELTHTELDFLNIHALYQYDVLLLQRWKSLFPEATFIPEFQLNLLQARPHIPLKGEVLGLVMHQATTAMFLFINGQFQFYNSFEITGEDDLSYYLLNVFEQFSLRDQVSKILVSGTDIEESYIEKLQRFSASDVRRLEASKPALALDQLERSISASYLLDLPTCVS